MKLGMPYPATSIGRLKFRIKLNVCHTYIMKNPINKIDLKWFFEIDRANLFKHGDRMYRIMYIVINQYFLLKIGTKKVMS